MSEKKQNKQSVQRTFFNPASSEHRQPMNFGFTSSLALPQEFLDDNPDMAYCFVAYDNELAQFSSRDQYTEAQDRNWVPVLLDSHPALKQRYGRPDYLKRNSPLSEYVVTCNQILMQKPVDEVEAAERRYEKMAQAEYMNTMKTYYQPGYEASASSLGMNLSNPYYG